MIRSVTPDSALRFGRRPLLRAAVFCLSALCPLLAAPPSQAQSWSSDNLKVAVGGLFLRVADTTSIPVQNKATLPSQAAGVRRLAGTGPSQWPVWSPDARTIAYLADGQKLTLLDVETLKSKPVDNHAVSPVVWSPDAKANDSKDTDAAKYAYIRANEDGKLALQVRRRAGGLALTLPLSYRDKNDKEIFITQLAPSTSASIAWVADTDNVLFAGGNNGQTDLYLMDQGQIERLTSSGNVLGFVVSSDGNRVRWVQRSRNSRYVLLSVYEMTIAERKEMKLSFPDIVPSINPEPKRSVDSVLSVAFSPDMNRIAFTTQGGPGAGADGTALYISDVNAKGVRLIGRGQPLYSKGSSSASPSNPSNDPRPPAIPEPPPNSKAIGEAGSLYFETTRLSFPALLPAFSPDSRQLAVVRLEGGKRYLMIINIDTDQRRMTLLP